MKYRFLWLIAFLSLYAMGDQTGFSQQLAMGSLPEINFHGRIIDQYGKPVSGAKIWFMGAHAYLASGGGRGYVETDADGYFSVDTSGAAFELGGVIHDEIDYVSYRRKGNINKSRQITSTILFTASDQHGEVFDYRRYDSRQHAFLVHAWRLQGYQGAKSGKTGYDIKTQSQVYTINLRAPDIHKSVREGVHPGDFTIACTRKPTMEHLQDYGDWKFELVAINGGIQKTDDLYMNIAPETGYQPAVFIKMKKSDPNFRFQLYAQQFYFTSNNGEVYGSLFARFLPFSRPDSCYFVVDYRYNDTGSRSLELKKEPRWIPPSKREKT